MAAFEQGIELEMRLTAAAEADPNWLAAARRGCALVMGGRVGAAQRHEALELTAALTQLTGPDWLLDTPDGQVMLNTIYM